MVFSVPFVGLNKASVKSDEIKYVSVQDGNDSLFNQKKLNAAKHRPKLLNQP